MKKIKLSGNKGKGKSALVDDDIFPKLNKMKWYITPNGYAANRQHLKGSGRKNRKTINTYLHRFITNCPTGKAVDHINGNRLDNRRENLRICTQKENLGNTFKIQKSSSVYKGVYLDKTTIKNKWVAQITINGKRVTIGHFPQERWAAMAYDIWAKEAFGKFAKTNF